MVKCSYDGCHRVRYAAELCNTHYAQLKRRSFLTPIRENSKYKPEFRDQHGHKYCPVCNSFKPTYLFNKSRRSVDGLDRKCGRCAVGIIRKSNFGISQEEYDRMLIESSGTCDLCEKPFKNVPREPVVDHDHRCCPGQKTCGECVRGLVHRSCNSFIGLAEDDERILQKAIEYLRRSGAKRRT